MSQTDRSSGSETTLDVQETRCCIAGCGPAGAMLGLLLARKGLDVVVLEKHGDFLRDFRGDTIHPSVMQIMEELGLAERLLQLKHSKVSQLRAYTPRGVITMADLRRLKTRYPYITFLPQWDFLDFIAAEASRYPGFHLVMNAEVRELIEEEGVVRGVRYRAPDGWHEVRALLTVGADGRSSHTRSAAGLQPIKTSPPMDVLWFRLSRRPDDPDTAFGRLGGGRALAFINRFDYWQVGYVIPKGTADRIRAEGIEAFKQSIGETVPEMADRVDELHDWSQVPLLTVESNRLKRWFRQGLLFIGDAAHAMSPVGGVGINYAIQDAVVAANVLAMPLKKGWVRLEDLAMVQRKREWPIRLMQALQTQVQRRALAPALGLSPVPRLLPALFTRLIRLPVLRDLPARLIAFGLWPVHVEN